MLQFIDGILIVLDIMGQHQIFMLCNNKLHHAYKILVGGVSSLSFIFNLILLDDSLSLNIVLPFSSLFIYLINSRGRWSLSLLSLGERRGALWRER